MILSKKLLYSSCFYLFSLASCVYGNVIYASEEEIFTDECSLFIDHSVQRALYQIDPYITHEDLTLLIRMLDILINIEKIRGPIQRMSALLQVQAARVNLLIIGKKQETPEEQIQNNLELLEECVVALKQKNAEYTALLIELYQTYTILNERTKDILSFIHQSIVEIVNSIHPLDEKTKQDYMLLVHNESYDIKKDLEDIALTFFDTSSTIRESLLKQQGIFANILFMSANLLCDNADVFFAFPLLATEILNKFKVNLERKLLS